MTFAIEADGLGKTYSTRSGPKTAVSGLTFQVDRGASLGIVGGSGAGKTTIASMLMGFIEPTAGSVLIDGEPRPSRLRGRERRTWARRIQIVFQDPYSSFDPRQRLGDVIDEVLRHHLRNLDRKGRRDRIAELFGSVGLAESLAGERAGALSGGQLQRVAIARALALEPRIIVLDEPVAALDVSVQAQILNLLAELRARLGLTYVLISHDLGVIRYSTDQLLVLRAGTIVERGDTSKVLDAPSDAYTRSLVDAAPESSLRATEHEVRPAPLMPAASGGAPAATAGVGRAQGDAGDQTKRDREDPQGAEDHAAHARGMTLKTPPTRNPTMPSW